MKLTTTARHFDSTPDLIEYIDARMRKLKRFWDHILNVDVIMSVEKFRHIAEVKVHVNGHDFAAKEESDDMRTSIDRTAKDLERQMKKFKGKLVTNAHKRGRGVSGSRASERIIGSASVGAAAGLEIADVIPLEIRDLGVDEAIVVMEDGGRNFLLFNNRESGKLNVVYKRADGDYGLIETF
jgi:putative sigma-54 modulation protein